MNPWRFQCPYGEPIKHPNLHSLIPLTFISTLCGCQRQSQLSSQIFLLSAMPPPHDSFTIFQLYLLFLLLDTLRVSVFSQLSVDFLTFLPPYSCWNRLLFPLFIQLKDIIYSWQILGLIWGQSSCHYNTELSGALWGACLHPVGNLDSWSNGK